MRMAKTHLPFSEQPELKGAATGLRLSIPNVRALLGVGFIYPLACTMRMMPGFSTRPPFTDADIDVETGKISGLF